MIPIWLKVILALPGVLIWWAVQLSLKAVVAFLGLFVVPFMYRYRNTKMMWVPSYFRPWLNPEDWTGGTRNNVGSIPDWWRQRMGDGKWSFYKYHAIRNPADGLRNYEWLNLRINPDRIWFKTDKFRQHYEPWYYAIDDDVPRVQWYICGQNLVWVGIKVQWIRKTGYTEFKFGTRIEPWDTIAGPDPKGSRALHGASFASKLILNRKYDED